MKQATILVAALLAAVVLLAGCGGAASSAAAPASAPASAPPSQASSAAPQTSSTAPESTAADSLSAGVVDTFASGEYLLHVMAYVTEEDGSVTEFEATVAATGGKRMILSTRGREIGDPMYYLMDGSTYVIDAATKTAEDLGEIGFDVAEYTVPTYRPVEDAAEVVSTGTDTVLDRELPYEEVNIYGESGTIKYYFQDGQLAVIQVALEGGDCAMDVMEFYDAVPQDQMALFSIPEDYTISKVE